MNLTTSRLAAAAVTATCALGLIAPATSRAAVTPNLKTVTAIYNLIKNPGAEENRAIHGATVTVKDWKYAHGHRLTIARYGTPGFPSGHAPGPKTRGLNMFVGGPGHKTSGGTQLISLKHQRTLIGASKARFLLTAWLGGEGSKGDDASVSVTWMTASGATLSTATIGPVTEAERQGVSGLHYRQVRGLVPSTATEALVSMQFVRMSGHYND